MERRRGDVERRGALAADLREPGGQEGESLFTEGCVAERGRLMIAE